MAPLCQVNLKVFAAEIVPLQIPLLLNKDALMQDTPRRMEKPLIIKDLSRIGC